jgi:hypothetical protein
VIEQRVEPTPDVIDDAEVDEPPGVGIDRPSHDDLDLVTVAVKALAFVPRWNPRQTMRSFEPILLGKLDLHGVRA